MSLTKQVNAVERTITSIDVATDALAVRYEDVGKKFSLLLGDKLGGRDDLGAAEMQRAIKEAMDESGYDDLIQDILDTEPEHMKELVDGLYKKFDIKMPQYSTRATANGLSQQLLLQQKSFATDALRSVINISRGTGEVPTSNIIRLAEDLYKTKITNGTSTMLQGLYRTTNELAGRKAKIKDYRYVGPLDDITRPFCRKHINEVKTMAEWNQLDNGQLDPVSVFGGGYNCRHELVPETEEVTDEEWQEAIDEGIAM